MTPVNACAAQSADAPAIQELQGTEVYKSPNNRIYKTGENHPNWKDGSGSYRAVGLSEKCEDCGETRYYLLVVHHINKNRKQNGDSNLVTLCFNCHGMRHLIVSEGKLCVHWGTLTTDDAKAMLARGVQPSLSF